MISVSVLVSVGSNLDPERNILRALELLMRQVQISDCSTFFETEPIGGAAGQANYLNGVWKMETRVAPKPLKFDILREVETHLGRVRTENRYADRPIDLDILLYGDRVIHEPGLQVPDPDLYQRSFLAIAAAEIDPNRIVPDTGKRLIDIATGFTEKKPVSAGNITRQLKERIRKQNE